MKKVVFIIALLIIGYTLFSQSFEQKTIDVGNIGMTLSNYGQVGQPNIRNETSGQPSLEYPINSGIEHLFEGGLWIGASVDGQTRVSTASVDAVNGFYTGGAGFEFTPLMTNGSYGIEERSTLSSSDYFSASAVSHQDLIAHITDSNNIVPGTNIQISGHDFPLDAVVQMKAFAWNFSFADFFVIIDYEITNESNEAWDSVYLGLWTDLVIRNVNVTQDGGSAFYNKGGGGFIDSFDALYAYQVNGDDYDYTQSYGSSQFLGVLWRDLYLHPNNVKLNEDSNYQYKVNGNFWTFRSFDGTDMGAPTNDIERYAKMKKGLNFPDPRLEVAGNKVQLLSFGPVPEVQPGETFTFAIAMVCAKQLAYKTDNDASRAELYEHLNWAKRTFLGEDLNENGKLDAGEDLNENNELDRYILPEPPASPKVKIVAENQKVDIYWDNSSVNSIDPISKKYDFEGFKLYRTKIGDDLDLNLQSSAKLIAQWDSAGNDIGYNNGFDLIKLDKPVVIDSVEYHFKYTIENLQNGWQYLFILTAFDEGDKKLKIEPLESSFTENSFSVFSGTPPADDVSDEIGVYPNPYRLSAAWDGTTSRSRKIYFYNLPEKCEIRIFTLSGELVRTLYHDAAYYDGGDIEWFDNFAGTGKKVFSGGEHAWDLLSENGQSITQGLYLFSVRDLKSDNEYLGKFAILK